MFSDFCEFACVSGRDARPSEIQRSGTRVCGLDSCGGGTSVDIQQTVALFPENPSDSLCLIFDPSGGSDTGCLC